MKIATALLALLISVIAAAADDDELDLVALAAVLVQDGHFDRAEEQLAQVDLSAEGIDGGRFHTISGMIALNRGESAQAEQSFQAAIDSGMIDATEQTPEVLYLYLAQVQFAQEKYEQALASLHDAGQTAARLPSAWLMRAHANWLLARRDETWSVLNQAQSRFPANAQFQRQRVFYLIELELYTEAAEYGLDFLAEQEGSVDDYVAIGNALRQGGQFDQALRFLETASLKFPFDVRVAKVLGYTWLEAGKPLAAAEIFYQASILDPEMVSEAAELYRRAGKLDRALMLNARITDPEKKLKQRLAIFVQLQRYSDLVAMEDALIRTGLLNDEDLRYALAYAQFQTGRYEEAETNLTMLTRGDLFRKATELRQAMEACRSEPWKCAG